MLVIRKELLEPKDSIKITNKHHVFKDSQYKDMDFTFEMKQPTRKDSVNIISKIGNIVDGDFAIDNGELSKLTFSTSVINWSGLQFDDGSEIPCDDSMKSALWESMPELTDLLQKALNEHVEKANKVKKVVKKKS